MAGDVLLDAVLGQLAAAGIDPLGWLLSWARLVPSLILIPAFGLEAFPVLLRFAYAFVLAAVIAPTLPPVSPGSGPWLTMLALEAARGVPVALAVAGAIWSAGMAGNLIDELRRGRGPRVLLADDTPLSPLGTVLSLLSVIAFFQLGGPARLADALAAAPPIGQQDLRSVALTLARSVQFAVLLCGPLLALVPFLQLARALIARSARPIAPGTLLQPLEALAVLALLALLLDRFATAIVLWLDRALPPA
jgi:type III secretory pathway component EscT